ncbi:outer membrane lipoprotein SlyB [Bartonella fuyuanensis]|uniref:Outer membrane lipoprotein SlyB n=1 Tax=Bartonella fuyuanensis TaxID=1460968 RepID=A0A840DRJ0_9HYPH|nr:hypothetical protein [Bartonella fuyuanensis]MBB4075731.1 outer membrane lipoprotein SlyB [Bartonella fuyuanensis]
MLKSIFKVAVVLVIGFSSVACTTNDERVARYGIGGAAIGALAGTAIAGTTPGAALTGAALGAFAGTVTGAAANQKRQQKQESQLCMYRGRRGSIYQAPCVQRIQQVQELCTYRNARGVMYQAPCPHRIR